MERNPLRYLGWKYFSLGLSVFGLAVLPQLFLAAGIAAFFRFDPARLLRFAASTWVNLGGLVLGVVILAWAGKLVYRRRHRRDAGLVELGWPLVLLCYALWLGTFLPVGVLLGLGTFLLFLAIPSPAVVLTGGVLVLLALLVLGVYANGWAAALAFQRVQARRVAMPPAPEEGHSPTD